MLLPPNIALSLVVAFVAFVAMFHAASASRVVDVADATTNAFPSMFRAQL
jgi:hypothetical protein